MTKYTKSSNICVSSENQEGPGPMEYLFSQNNEGPPFHRNVPTTHNRTFLLLSTTFLIWLMKKCFFGGLNSACFYGRKNRIIYSKNNSYSTLRNFFSPMTCFGHFIFIFIPSFCPTLVENLCGSVYLKSFDFIIVP